MANMAPKRIDTVNGQAADTIHNHGPVYFGCPERCDDQVTAERQLKATAARRYSRELDVILDNADLNARQVLHAWGTHALGGRNGRVVRQFTVLDYSACVLFLVPLSLYLVVLGWGFTTANLSPLAGAQCLGALLFLSACVGLVLHQHFWPQLIAKKALQALEQHSSTQSDIS